MDVTVGERMAVPVSKELDFDPVLGSSRRDGLPNPAVSWLVGSADSTGVSVSDSSSSARSFAFQLKSNFGDAFDASSSSSSLFSVVS